jgi:hypothetical protein
MSPLSPPVLGAAALLTSPALAEAFVAGSLDAGDALVRFLVAVAVCWVGFNAAAALVRHTSAPAAAGDPEEPADHSRPSTSL